MPRNTTRKLVREQNGNDVYEYYPLGQYIVIAPRVCGGRPTFKGTRVEVKVILDWLRAGEPIDDILKGYPRVSREAVQEAIGLATDAFVRQHRRRAA